MDNAIRSLELMDVSIVCIYIHLTIWFVQTLAVETHTSGERERAGAFTDGGSGRSGVSAGKNGSLGK